VKLNEVPSNTKVRIIQDTVCKASRLHSRFKTDELLVFKNESGAYSFCINKNREVVRLPVDIDVEIVV